MRLFAKLSLAVAIASIINGEVTLAEAEQENHATTCKVEYDGTDLTIPHVKIVENNIGLADVVLSKVSNGKTSFEVKSLLPIETDSYSECGVFYNQQGILTIPHVQIVSGGNYSVLLKSDSNSVLSPIYFQQIDATPVTSINIEQRSINVEALFHAIANYFGKPNMVFKTAYELKHIAILQGEEGYFIAAKHEWLSPIIGFAQNNPVENGQLINTLVGLDLSIDTKVFLGESMPESQANNNKERWTSVFTLLQHQDSRRTSSSNLFSVVEEEKYIPLNLWNLDQTGTVNGIKINQYTPTDGGKETPVGCAPLAIARIMNYHQYPVGDVFNTGNQYYSLNKNTVTDAFAHLVRDIGVPNNISYTAKGTGFGRDLYVNLFNLADYNVTRLLDVGDSRSSASQLYIAVRNEINSSRPALLSMRWNSSNCPDNSCAHAVVITGYMKTDPPFSALEDLYVQLGLGWRQTKQGKVEYIDQYMMQLDDYGWFGFSKFIAGIVTPYIPLFGNEGNTQYTLFGGISPKKTQYNLTVNSNNGNVRSSSTGANINCGNGSSSCSSNIYTKTKVTLTATPLSGYTFSGWGGSCSGSSTTCTVTMDSAKSVTANFVSKPTKPVAPSSMSASALSSNSVKLTWADSSNNETGFYLYRYGSGWVRIATLGANTTSYTDSGLNANTTYYYTVESYNSAGSAQLTQGAGYVSATTQNVTAITKGLDLDGYCRAVYGSSFKAIVTNQSSAFSWACASGSTMRGMDLDYACKLQNGAAYGKAAYGSATNPYSWYCKAP